MILAIDFGTSNSLVGAWVDGKRVEALPLDPGAPDPTLLRTLLYFLDKDHCYYGVDAIEKYIENEMQGRLFRSFKSHLSNRNYLGTFIDDRVLTLENTIGIFLLEMKKRAEKHLGKKAKRAVIGRPARYSMDPMNDNFALHRMKKAAEFAGFEEINFVPEPLAAAFDYRRGLKSEKIVLIGDFGGGTSDFTLIRMGPFDFKKDDVLSIDGCPLAGDALDSLFMSRKLNEWFGAKSQYKMFLGQNVMTMPRAVMDRLNYPAHIVHLKEKATYDFIREVRKGALSPQDEQALDRLFVTIEDQQIFAVFEQIEKSKIALSKSNEDKFAFDYPGIEIKDQFSRGQFEEWAKSVSDPIFTALNRCLDQAGLKYADVDLVCLTGGSAQVPLIREGLRERFGVEKLQTQAHFHSVLSGLIESASFYSKGIAVV